MTTLRTIASLSTLAALCACTPDRWGTQIGTEDSLTCTLESSETLTDLDALPDDFADSPSTLLAGVAGTYSGEQFDEEEGDTGEDPQGNGLTADLVVSNPGGDVVLERYFPALSEDDLAQLDDDDLVRICPPSLVTTLDYVLTADGLPDLDTSLETRIANDGAVAASFSGQGDYADALPSPTTFDPDDFGQVEANTRLRGTASQWSVTVDWTAWNPEDAAPDGDVAKTRELLVQATLNAE